MNVLVAGATGYLGRFLCAEYARRGHHVSALVRDAARAEGLADLSIEAEATRPETLEGIMDGMDLVVSSLGITRQADGLGYREVDFQANLNLLREAETAGVRRFAYVHVLAGTTIVRNVCHWLAPSDLVSFTRSGSTSWEPL